MLCAICQDQTAHAGVLCRDCQDDLPVGTLTPEQVVSAGTKGQAALIDAWGRAHGLPPSATIGRSVDGTSLGILDPGISRRHARIQYDRAARAWTINDEHSSNGSFVNDTPVDALTVLRRGDRVTFGRVGFYFFDDAKSLPSADVTPIEVSTLPQAKSDTLFTERDLHTDVGLPTIEIKLSEPTGGGGGMVEIAGKQIQLTMTQFEFVRFMVERMASEAHQPELVRGFVRTSELIGQLSWDSYDPGDNHVKQLVRRVRRAFVKAGVGDLIESRHRFGYRLRAIPK